MSGREKGKISIKTALQKRDATLYLHLETIWSAIVREIQKSDILAEIRDALLPKLISSEIRAKVG